MSAAPDVVDAFRAAMREHGLVPPEHIDGDGRIHRCDVDGKNGRGDGAYLLHLDGGIPAGGFQNWQHGGWQDWCSKDTRTATADELVRMRESVERSRAERERESARRKAEAAARAKDIWNRGTPAPADHPYLLRKGVRASELRKVSGIELIIAGTDCEGALIAPIRDSSGKLHSLEFITADGEKRYLPGGHIAGCYFSIGGKPTKTIVIAEGVATAYSIHEATGEPVACAFNAGNLVPVAKALREKMPKIDIVFAADNDVGDGVNVGMEKAREAATAVSGLVAVPDIDGTACDFNDMMLKLGATAVKAAIGAATKPVTASAIPVLAPSVALRRASEIEIEPISWLWSGWLAAGKLHILAGVPGTGKTTIALSLASIVTRGGKWPDGTPFCSPGNVLIWSGEDDASDTLVPRLTAMGADLNRIRFVGDVNDQEGRRPFDPAYDMPGLITAAQQVGDVRLLIVDPIVNTVSGDSHKNGEVRRGLAPLVSFGHELRAAVLGISHFSKGTAGKDPLDRITGSLAFGALARLVFGAARKLDQETGQESRLMVRIKSNIGPDGGGLSYTLGLAELPQGIQTSRIEWGAKLEGNARDILAEAEQAETDDEEASALDDAKRCLREILADGNPREAKQALREARDAGHAERTVRRAREELGIRPKRDGNTGKWYWRLPDQDGQPLRTRNDGHLGHLAPNAGLESNSGGLNGQGVQGGQGSEFGEGGHLAGVETF